MKLGPILGQSNREYIPLALHLHVERPFDESNDRRLEFFEERFFSSFNEGIVNFEVEFREEWLFIRSSKPTPGFAVKLEEKLSSPCESPEFARSIRRDDNFAPISKRTRTFHYKVEPA